MMRQGFRGGLDPVLFAVGAFQGTTNLDEDNQPGGFCEYVETQLRLAEVLKAIDLPYEAERVLGECTRTTQLLCDTRQGILRYQVARANSWAQTALLLSEDRPRESAAALKWATTIWTRTLSQFPNAPLYRSGVHGHTRDLAWFRQHFSEQPLDGGPANDRPHDENSVVRETTFVQHALGISVFRSGMWKWSIDFFNRAAELRTHDAAYDWLHIAMAQHHLNNKAEARRTFEKAASTVEEPGTELLSIFERAEHLLEGRSRRDRTHCVGGANAVSASRDRAVRYFIGFYGC